MLRVIRSVPEDSLPHDSHRRTLCPVCREVTDDWSPVDGVVWHTCQCCGLVVLALQPTEQMAAVERE